MYITGCNHSWTTQRKIKATTPPTIVVSALDGSAVVNEINC